MVSYRQVTDAHLFELAIAHGGYVVTFDRGVRELVPPESDAEDRVRLIR